MAQRPELLGPIAPEDGGERAPNGRLLGEAQVVADAEVARGDGVGGLRLHLRRPAQEGGHQMTLAKFGSRRLNTQVVRTRNTRLASRRTASAWRSGVVGIVAG